jgi:demethylmenaquinone methyltransferase/2-methoxy-6-polyprenyl-1,4-benzoquinol methylase
MSYVFMKVLESAPERYDRGMRLLTLGRLERVHRDIADRVSAGDRVLELGCGTGALAARLVRKGVDVTGIDIAPQMLEQASRRLRTEGLEGKARLLDVSVVDLDTLFRDGRFDAVACTLVLSELSADEIEYTLVECRRVLRPEGVLFVADEILPDSVAGKAATFLFRLPFALLAYVLTQNTSHRVSGLEGRIREAGFSISEARDYLAGTLQLLVAKKEG